MGLEFSIETNKKTETRQTVLDRFWRSLLSAGDAATVLDALASALAALTGCETRAFCLDPDSGELFSPGRLHAPSLIAPSLSAQIFPESSGPLRLELTLAQDNPAWNEFIASNREALDRAGWRLAWALPAGGSLAGMVFLCAGSRIQRRSARGAMELAVRGALLSLDRLAASEQTRRSAFEYRLKLLEIETLRDVGVALVSLLDLDCLCRELLTRATSLLNTNRAAVLLTGEHGSTGNGPELRIRESFNLDSSQAAALEKFTADRLIDKLAAGHTLKMNDPGELPSATGCGKLLAAPVRQKGELLGAILTADKEGRHGALPDFDGEDEGLLNSIANFAGAAVSNARLYRNVNEIKRYNESILACIASGVITTGTRGEIVSFNASAASIFGLDETAASKIGLAGLFKSIGCAGLARKLRPALENGIPCQETALRGRRADGSGLVLNVSAAPLLDDSTGSISGMVVSVENISEGARVKEMLKRYVSPAVAELALTRDGGLELGGELREVTVLFADIRGFTALAELRSPAEVVELLNQYFDLMIDVVFRMNGTVDKIVGDEIMVLFGAPVDFPDDTRRAALCALAMRRELARFNSLRAGRGEPPLEAGIGINRGSVISGNIGSKKRMDYTVIGDTVNLASRLVSAARPGEIIVSRSAAVCLDSSFTLQDMGSLKVKGRREPVEVLRLLDGPAE